MDEAPTRVNFFDGMLLTGEDLRVEQEYCLRMRRLHNRLHGHGIVEGLGVTLDRGSGQLRVDPGWALDDLGREVVVSEPRVVEAPRDRLTDLVLSWAEVPAQPVPARPDDATLYSRWIERPELTLCPPDERPEAGLVLARVRRSRLGKLTVDPTVRRPLGRD